MVLDQVIQFLSESLVDRHEADTIARTAFMEWLWSLPDGANFAELAVEAGERVVRSGGDTPALAAFRGLLLEATCTPVVPVRRGGARQRRQG